RVGLILGRRGRWSWTRARLREVDGEVGEVVLRHLHEVGPRDAAGSESTIDLDPLQEPLLVRRPRHAVRCVVLGGADHPGMTATEHVEVLMRSLDGLVDGRNHGRRVVVAVTVGSAVALVVGHAAYPRPDG